jgi:hypothetical protein
MAGNLGGLVVALIVQGLLGHPALAFIAMALALLVGLPFTAGARFRLAARVLTSTRGVGQDGGRDRQ